MTTTTELIICNLQSKLDSIQIIGSEFLEADFKVSITNAMVQAQELNVNSSDTFNLASVIYKHTKHVRDKLDEWRKSANRPYREKIEEINDHAKEFTDVLREIEDITKAKMEQWHLAQQSEKKQQIENLRLAAEMFGVEDEVEVTAENKKSQGYGATIYSQQVKRFRIKNLAEVPPEFLMLNEQAVEETIKSGRIVPGVEIYQETITKIKRTS